MKRRKTKLSLSDSLVFWAGHARASGTGAIIRLESVFVSLFDEGKGALAHGELCLLAIQRRTRGTQINRRSSLLRQDAMTTKRGFESGLDLAAIQEGATAHRILR